MRRSVLVLLALLPTASIVAPAVDAAPTKTPSSPVIFRPECFGMVLGEGQQRFGALGPGAGGGQLQGNAGGVVGGVAGGVVGGAVGGAAAQPTVATPPAPPVASTSSTSRSSSRSGKLKAAEEAQTAQTAQAPRTETLSKEVLEQIPAGRSFQSAVQTVPGATTDATSTGKRKPKGDGGGKGGDGRASPEAKKNVPVAAPAEPNVAEPAKNVETRAPRRDKVAKNGEKRKQPSAQMPADEPEAAPGYWEDEENLDGDDRTIASDLEPAPAPAPEPARQLEPVLDWGATVYLSNDDSMSLASAQRLLYAAMNHLPFTVSQIRPHELLNYFSFDTVTPSADQLFDVLASAEQHGDQLSVALAVKGASPTRQPLDLTLVVDRSCSMADSGRMDYTRRGLSLMSDQLDAGDRLDVVLFDDRVCVPLENYVVGRDDPALLQQTIAWMQPEGSTDVGLGLRTAYGVAKAKTETHGRNRRVMVLTDALMNTGDVDPNTVSEIGRAYEADGIRLTGIGVGREFDDTVLDMLTEKGKGAYVFLGSEAVVDRVFGATGFDQLVQTIAHDVHFALKLPKSLAMERFYGEEASTVMEEVQPINYSSGTSQLFLQDLVIKDGKPVKADPVELEISYRDAVTGEPETRRFRTTVGAMLEADPHNVRKGLALMAWTDVLTEAAMGGDPCGAPLAKYAERASLLQQDAEIAFVNGLIQGRCGAFELSRVVTDAGGVPFKVRVDADIPISTVALACAGARSTESLSGSDVIAMFTAPPGVCELTLSGTVDMTAKVEIPATGGDLRCIVRGGRLSCT